MNGTPVDHKDFPIGPEEARGVGRSGSGSDTALAEMLKKRRFTSNVEEDKPGEPTISPKK